MLTKQERAEIAERFRNYDKAEYVTLYSGMYDGLFGEHVPKETTVKKDRMELASRILELCDTSNMLELPVDKDGEVIHVGDVVYVGDREFTVNGFIFNDNGVTVRVVHTKLSALNFYKSNELTHKKTVTITSILSEFRDVLNYYRGMTEETFLELSRIADQLEMLGDTDD